MNTHVKKLTLSVLVVSALLFNGCAKYRPRTLAFSGGNVQENDDLEVSTKALTDQECKSIFDRKIVSRGFQPVQINIKNKSDRVFVLDANDIDLQIERIDKVSKKMHFNTAKRMLSWGIAGLFVWPCFIPALAEGYNASKANREIDEDFELRGIDTNERLVIGPHSAISKVFFVANRNYRSNFNVRFAAKNGGDKIEFII